MRFINPQSNSQTFTFLRSLISQNIPKSSSSSSSSSSSYSTVNGSSGVPKLTKIIKRSRHRSQAIKQARELLTEYLQCTRELPYIYADLIIKNSTKNLYEIISKVPFSTSKFETDFREFLRYHPIKEYGFFFESIGIDFADVGLFLKPNVNLISDDFTVFDAACCLAQFGFPWDKLGTLYAAEVSIFSMETGFLKGRLNGLVELGFSKQQVIGICLAIPDLLKVKDGDFDAMLVDLKRVFIDFDFGSRVESSVDVWFEVSRKVRVFYDLGVAKGEVGELLVKGRRILNDFSEEVLVEKVDFFSRLDVDKAEIGLLILSNPEILDIELVGRVISVSSILEHFGLPRNKLEAAEDNYKYVFGRNKMVNLPCILKALNLHEWFFDRMKCGYYKLFVDYDLSSPDDGVDENYSRSLERVKSAKTCSYSCSKLEFFHGIGFGENGYTMKIVAAVHASPSALQERFDFMLSEGIKWSELCRMINRSPTIFRQGIDSFKEKIDFFREKIGLPMDHMEIFPTYLLHNLENRIKPRFEFYEWLIEQGSSAKRYSLSTIFAASHKMFIRMLSSMHPEAPKLWLERYGDKKSD